MIKHSKITITVTANNNNHKMKQKLDLQLNSISNWLYKYKLTLNLTKTKYMILGTTATLKRIGNIELQINNIIIEQVIWLNTSGW